MRYNGSEHVEWTQQYEIDGPHTHTGWQPDGDYLYYDSPNSLNFARNTFRDTPTIGPNSGQLNVCWSALDQVINVQTGKVTAHCDSGPAEITNTPLTFSWKRLRPSREIRHSL
jgi:hypothetical protein